MRNTNSSSCLSFPFSFLRGSFRPKKYFPTIQMVPAFSPSPFHPLCRPLLKLALELIIATLYIQLLSIPHMTSFIAINIILFIFVALMIFIISCAFLVCRNVSYAIVRIFSLHGVYRDGGHAKTSYGCLRGCSLWTREHSYFHTKPYDFHRLNL